MPFVLSDAGIRVHYVIYRPGSASSASSSSAAPHRTPTPPPQSPSLVYLSDSDSDDESLSNTTPKDVPFPGADSLPTIDFSKPTVVMLHPEFFGSDVWENQYTDAAYGGRYNLVGLDIHYHGLTRVPMDDKPWDWPWVARDVISAIRNLGIVRTHVHCACFGTHLALLMSSIAPELFESLTFTGMVAFEELPETRLSYQQLQDACFDPQPGDDPRRFPSDVVMGVTWACFCDNPLCYDYLGRWNAYTPFFPIDRLLVDKVYSAVKDRPPMTRAAVESVTCPVLAVHGGIDACCPVDEARKLFGLLSNARRKRMEVLDGAPHFLFMTHRNVVNRLVVDFLDGVEADKLVDRAQKLRLE